MNGTEDAATGAQGADAPVASPPLAMEATPASSDIPARPGSPLDDHAPWQDAPAQAVPMQDASVQDVPMQDASVQAVPVQAKPVPGAAVPADPRPWGVPDVRPPLDPVVAGAPGRWGEDPQAAAYGHAPDGPAPYGPAPYGPAPYGQPPYGPASYGPALDGSAVPRVGRFGPPPPARMPHRWGLGAYVLVEAVFLLVSVLLGYLFAGKLTSSAGVVALALVVPTLCAAGLALLITRIRGNGPRIDLGLHVSKRDILVGLTCGVAGLAITIPASLVYAAIAGADAGSAVGEVLGGVHAGPALAVTIFVIVVFVAPVCEEIVYRGLLWGAVERLGANRWWTLVVTTIVFALAHFEFSRTPLLLVVAIPIGVARLITGRLSAGVIAHQINNLLPGIVLALGLLGVVPMT